MLGITTKIISPVRLLDSITGKEKLFDTDIFDERTSHVIKSVKVPVAILIEKSLNKIEEIFIPLFTASDRFLLEFAGKMALHSAVKLTIIDPPGIIEQEPLMKESLNGLYTIARGRINLHSAKALEKDFLQKQDLMIISHESWKKAVESHSIWLSFSPSVLIIRG